MNGKFVRVVVTDQPAIVHLQCMIFPIVHVAGATPEDDAMHSQRGANDNGQPKTTHLLEKTDANPLHPSLLLPQLRSCLARFGRL